MGNWPEYDPNLASLPKLKRLLFAFVSFLSALFEVLESSKATLHEGKSTPLMLEPVLQRPLGSTRSVGSFPT